LSAKSRFFLIISLFALILIASCSHKPPLLFQNQTPKEEPFLDYDAYTQQDILFAEKENSSDEQVKQVISALNAMDFSVDSCVASENYVFVRTPFTFKNDYFRTPKHQYLKISLLVEVPRKSGLALQIKYAVCTTCARCEEWYCDQLPAWAESEKYRISEQIQRLIFHFKEKLKFIKNGS